MSPPPKHCPLWLFYTPVVCLSQLRNYQCYIDINWTAYFSGFHYSFSNILFLIPGSLQDPALQLWLLGLLSAMEFSRRSLPLKILATLTVTACSVIFENTCYTLLKTFSYFDVFVCVHMCTNACAHSVTHMWRSEGHWQELFFSLHHVHAGDCTQVIRLGSKCFPSQASSPALEWLLSCADLMFSS